MQQFALLISCVCALVTIPLRAADKIDVTDEAARVVLRNDRLTLALGKAENGAIVSLVDHASGQEFAAQQTAPRLFTLTFSKKDDAGSERFYLSSRDAKSFAADVKRGVATLDYDGLGEWPVQVTCTAGTKPDDPLVRWRLSVKIPDALVLEEVQFPFAVLRAPLGDSMEDDAAVFGHSKGGVIRQPGAMKAGSRVYGQQPGSLAAQFGCYYDDRAGFYTAAYDAKGYPKNFEMRRTAEGVEMDWNPHGFAAESYTMDFDVVMTTFTGADKATPTDWRDAADIYKEWALRQPWCATPYSKRNDIPSWMKAGPAMVRFSREWLAEPSRIEKWLADYWQKHFPDAPLITAYWGWEKVGSWVTPDYFPVFPSDQEFTNLVARTRPFGCHAFPWPSGYNWTLRYRKQDDGSFFWDDRKRFDEIARAHAVRGRDGKIYVQKAGWLAGGDMATMCPGDPWTIHWWNNDICAPLARRGCEMIQVDQVVGGRNPFCYSREHAHPPGPGVWQTEAFAEQLRTMLATTRQTHPDAVVCYEGPNEWFNHLVGIQDYRDCEWPGEWASEASHEWASVFNYLYHEFLPAFQSNPLGGDRAMAAYCLVNGQIPHLVPTMQFGTGPALINGGFEETNATPGAFIGWEHLRSYNGQAWNGKASCDEAEKHDGIASLRLENVVDSDIVQVSQNVMVTEGSLTAGKKYRLGAWLKTGRMVQANAIGMAFSVKNTGFKNVGRIVMPAEGMGWTRGSAEFAVPAGAAFLRIMIHVAGPATVWVDDVTLEEVRADGTTAPVIRSPQPPDHELMRRWVELYHGEGRPWLQFGRMLHPPKLTCATITHHDRPMRAVRHNAFQMPAVLHNAFRAPDGHEAVVLANATNERQAAILSWKGRVLRFELKPDEIVLTR